MLASRHLNVIPCASPKVAEIIVLIMASSISTLLVSDHLYLASSNMSDPTNSVCVALGRDNL